jgi:purine-cytosine permease-like protein
MNYRLVLTLSLFGLAMGIATVFVIPSSIEPLFWLAIFVICALVIARRVESRHFLHGFLVSLTNGVWITTAHVALFHQYVARHPAEAAMAEGMPLGARAMMAVTGPIIGVVSGLVLGLFCYAAARLTRRPSGRVAAGT